MGWKGTLRSMNAASNRAARESDKRGRSLQRGLAKVDRGRDQALKKVVAFEKRLEKDVIKALDLKYADADGLTATPFTLDTDLFSGSIGLLPSAGDDTDIVPFRPAHFEHGSVRITPVRLILTRWATLVVFRAAHDNPN